MAAINWAQLQEAAGEASFDPLPPSVYDVIVDSAEATTSSTNKDMIKTVFKVEGGPYAGKKVFNQFVLTTDNQNALAFFFRHMAAMGLNNAFFAANPSMAQVASSLVGQRARVKLSIREYQGQDRNQVDAVMPAIAGGSLPQATHLTTSAVTPHSVGPAPTVQSPAPQVVYAPPSAPVVVPPTPQPAAVPPVATAPPVTPPAAVPPQPAAPLVAADVPAPDLPF
jgi:hypothetical protein